MNNRNVNPTRRGAFDKKMLEVRDYLESFVKNYGGKHIHLIDVVTHLRKIESFEEELEILNEVEND